MALKKSSDRFIKDTKIRAKEYIKTGDKPDSVFIFPRKINGNHFSCCCVAATILAAHHALSTKDRELGTALHASKDLAVSPSRLYREAPFRMSPLEMPRSVSRFERLCSHLSRAETRATGVTRYHFLTQLSALSSQYPTDCRKLIPDRRVSTCPDFPPFPPRWDRAIACPP
ncbi:MAG: hypothetical protein IPK84_00750 [Candidatus Moraniibacteriota bacterium]|nr:MAG: hypothetical protein IPK84_00750 [Candidatus Moranbacteria bacterium]